MKFKLIVVVAVLAAFAALAPVVSAQNEFNDGVQDVRNIFTGQAHQLAGNLCANSAPGSIMEASWCYGTVINPRGYVEGYNPHAAYRGSYYGRYGNYRHRGGNVLSRIFHGVFRPEPYYPYGSRMGYDGWGGVYYAGNPQAEVVRERSKAEERAAKARARESKALSEAISSCFKSSMETLRKQKVHVDERLTAVIHAQCTGALNSQMDAERQEALSPASEAPAPVPPPAIETAPEPTKAPVIRTEQPRKERGAVVWNGRLCNESGKPLRIFVDGEYFGEIPPWDRYPLSRIPGSDTENRVTWNYWRTQRGRIKRPLNPASRGKEIE